MQIERPGPSASMSPPRAARGEESHGAVKPTSRTQSGAPVAGLLSGSQGFVAGDAVLRTSGGSIKARNAGGRLMAKTSGGSIEASFAHGNSKGGDLDTSAGSVEVALDPGSNLSVEASTSAGRISTEFPLKVQGTIGSSSLRGTLGKGGEALRIHTSAGSIELLALK